MSLTSLPFKPDGPAEEKTMASSFYKSWWREMGAISRGMMFVEGNLSTSASLENTTSIARPAREADDQALPVTPVAAGYRKKANRLYRNFLFLGGRPMTPGHNDDIDEPFPQMEDDEPAPQPRFALPQYAKPTQSQPCATC